MDIRTRLNKEMLILDGAMGTMMRQETREQKNLRSPNFSERFGAINDCPDILCLTAPELIYSIHTAYLEAGADIISTNTFNSNSISLAGYGLSGQVEKICKGAAGVAREAVDDFCRRHNIGEERRPYVAGIMGPTHVSLSSRMKESGDPEAEFKKMEQAFYEQAANLIESGVDMLWVETIFDLQNAKAAVEGMEKAFRTTGNRLPFSLSATIDKDGKLLSGHSLSEFAATMLQARPLSIGLNCGFGVEALSPYVKELAEMPELSDTFISFHPNAGQPDAYGHYPDTPELMAAHMSGLLSKSRVDIVGGCCGSTPDHTLKLVTIRAKFRVTPQ